MKGRTKHLTVKLHHITNKINEELVVVMYIPEDRDLAYFTETVYPELKVTASLCTYVAPQDFIVSPGCIRASFVFVN